MKGKIPILLFAMVALILAPMHVAASPLEANRGWIGYGLYFSVEAPKEAKVGEFITVVFKFQAKYDMHIAQLSVSLSGAADYSRTIIIDADIKRDTLIIDTAIVKLTAENVTSCSIKAEYNYYDFYLGMRYYEYGDLTIDITWARYTTYDELLAKYNDLKAKYDQLKTVYDELLAKYNDLTTNYDSLKSKHDTLEKAYASLNSSYTTLQGDYKSLNSSYTSLQRDYKSLNSSYTSLQADYNSLKASRDSLQASYNSLQAKYNDLESKYKASMDELSTTRNLMYVFIITTIVFIGTTVYIAAKKPKPPT